MILVISQNKDKKTLIAKAGVALAEKFKKDFRLVAANEVENIADYCQENEASFLLIQLTDSKINTVQKNLNACRDLRIPYIFWKNNFTAFYAKKILVPVTFLEEEIEKAQFAAAFGRFFSTHITVLQANDYGSKAKTTVEKMITFFDKFSLNYEIKYAKKDSFKLEKESVEIAKSQNFDLLLISASRTYGLDDVIFGPHERKTIINSDIPVILVNPRADLYALCD
ncbi:MAG: universal stress protein [Paludibacter sp.]|nr:universal stress protein [Paludibacter sp.]